MASLSAVVIGILSLQLASGVVKKDNARYVKLLEAATKILKECASKAGTDPTKTQPAILKCTAEQQAPYKETIPKEFFEMFLDQSIHWKTKDWGKAFWASSKTDQFAKDAADMIAYAVDHLPIETLTDDGGMHRQDTVKPRLQHIDEV